MGNIKSKYVEERDKKIKKEFDIMYNSGEYKTKGKAMIALAMKFDVDTYTIQRALQKFK